MQTFVSNAYGKLKKVLLCPIDNYRIMPINFVARQWIEKGHAMDYGLCKKQHLALKQAYIDNGVEVELIEPAEGLVYQVFARDFGICLKEGYVLGRFKEPCRRDETAEYEKKLDELGVPCIARCTAGCFEGGDFCFLDENTLLMGVIDRTDPAGFESVRHQLNDWGYEMAPVRVDRKYLHIDVCVNIIAEKTVIICPDILPDSIVKRFLRRNFEMIRISCEEVMAYAANIQGLGGGKVISSHTNTKTNARMRALGLDVVEVDISEIVKGGGGIHCMTFPLVRESV
jgi:N-dimethylarginine dimethylaminohydrolase